MKSRFRVMIGMLGLVSISAMAEMVQVGDDFLLANIPSDKYSELVIGREISIPDVTYYLISRTENGSSAHLNALLSEDGFLLQSNTDLSTGKKLNDAQLKNVYDSSKCSAWWTPVKPTGSQNLDGLYWKIPSDHAFPLKRFSYAHNIFTHSDSADMWENQLNIDCKDVAESLLTVKDIKRAFGSEVIVRIEK